jgi:SEFIR domain-containing protein/TIR domain-containing protein
MPVRVFIAYSHDSDAHLARVLQLATRLRGDGVDAWLDQFSPAPEEGWPAWTARQIAEAEFVVVVCTAPYAERFSRPPGQGTGTGWEANLIRQELYRTGGNRRFIPVWFEDERHVPAELQPYQRYHLPGDYERLLKHVTGRLAVPAPPVGVSGGSTPAGARRVKVFLGYATADAATAERVTRALSGSGLDVFPPYVEGESRVDWLSRGLEEAEYVLLLYSRAAKADPLIDRTWKSTLSAGSDVVLLPVRLEREVEVPRLLRDRGFDCADSFEAGMEKLSRFFERERSSPQVLVHGPASVLSGASRAQVRTVALGCMSREDLRETLGITAEAALNLGTELATVLHDPAYEGTLEKLYRLLETEHREEIKARRTWG